MKRRSFLARAAISVAAFVFPPLKAKLDAAPSADDGFRFDRAAIDDRRDFRWIGTQRHGPEPERGCGFGLVFGKMLQRVEHDTFIRKDGTRYTEARDVSEHKLFFAGLNIPQNASASDVADGLELMAKRLRSGDLVSWYEPWEESEITGYSSKREPIREKPECREYVTEETTLDAMRKVGLA